MHGINANERNLFEDKYYVLLTGLFNINKN